MDFDIYRIDKYEEEQELKYKQICDEEFKTHNLLSESLFKIEDALDSLEKLSYISDDVYPDIDNFIWQAKDKLEVLKMGIN
ncbi:TPA: hypothetical protein RTG63_001724, partial [Campylobacter jejuni]|nr:hypothetical protein [Campylobacter jejuni]